MKIKTSDLSGTVLDWAVAKCEGVASLERIEDHLTPSGNLPYCFDLFHDIKTPDEVHDILAGKPHCSGLGAEELRNFAAEMGYTLDRPVHKPYSTDWVQGGPIIEREGITIRRFVILENDLQWGAYEMPSTWKVKPRCFYGPTPLVAAMRCYVASKLGDEVGVPDCLI